MCYISVERVKLCRHSCMIFARLLDAKMKIHIFENYMVIYTGWKMDENQGDFREEQRAYCKMRGLLGKSTSEIKVWIGYNVQREYSSIQNTCQMGILI